MKENHNMLLINGKNMDQNSIATASKINPKDKPLSKSPDETFPKLNTSSKIMFEVLQN